MRITSPLSEEVLDAASDEQLDRWLDGSWTTASTAAAQVTLHDLMIRVIDPDTGAGKLINLGENLNHIQKLLLDLWCPDWLSGDYKLKPGLREDVLKARQHGCSTLVLALMFLTVYNNPYTYAITMAHDADHTERMFQIVKRFYEHLPDSKKRKAKYDTRRELRWEDTDSGIFVAQAGSGNVGRSGTWTLVHMSERARWQVPFNGAAELEAGLLAAVPRSGVAWKETTAQGLNDYYDSYQKAKKGESAFTPRFFGWNLHPDYQFWPPEQKDRPWRITEAEQLLVKTYHLTDAQLAWRRWKKREQGDLFEQEYPICLTPDAQIGTNRGIMSVMDVLPGDMTESGKVEALCVNLEHPVYRLTTTMGRGLRGTRDHPIATPDGFTLLAELQPGTRLTLRAPLFSDHVHVAEWRPIPPATCSIPIDPGLGRLIGYFMGDGSWYCKVISFCCDAKDEDVADDIQDLACQYLGVQLNRRAISVTQGRAGAIELRTRCAKCEPWLSGLNLLKHNVRAGKGDGSAGTLVRQVCVPECIKLSPRSVVREFLSGLFEADGSVSPNGAVRLGARFSTFLQDVQLLLLGFGINSTLTSNPRKAGNGAVYEQWMLTLNVAASVIFHQEIGFVGARKRGRAIASGKGKGRPSVNEMVDYVQSVEPDGYSHVYNLEVEGTHVFAANGILTHNCDAEAFRSSSENAYFDRNYLHKLLHELNGPEHAPIEVIEAGQRGFSGKVEVYREYDPEFDYLVTGDPAQGVTEYGTDYSVARVMCIQTWEECVVYEGKPSLGKFASDMAALGSHYGGAEVCPLRHAHGHAVVLALEQIERYPNLYHHQAFDDTQRLRGEGPILAKPGYPESSRTKPEMMDSLAEVISDMAQGEKGLILHSRRGVEQLLTYIRLPGAKTGTGEGSAHDDHVSTLAVAVMRLLDRQKRWTTPRKQAPPRLLYGSR